MQYLVYGVADKGTGEVDLTLDDDETITEPVVILTLEAVDAESLEKTLVEVVLTRSSGFRVIEALLTDEQLEAALGA